MSRSSARQACGVFGKPCGRTRIAPAHIKCSSAEWCLFLPPFCKRWSKRKPLLHDFCLFFYDDEACPVTGWASEAWDTVSICAWAAPSMYRLGEWFSLQGLEAGQRAAGLRGSLQAGRLWNVQRGHSRWHYHSHLLWYTRLHRSRGIGNLSLARKTFFGHEKRRLALEQQVYSLVSLATPYLTAGCKVSS